MKKELLRMALLIPLLAVLIVIGFAGGLGIIFMLLNESVLEEWGVVALGMALVVGVPSVAALAQRIVERR